MKTFAEVASFLRQNEIGRRACIDTPWGRRLLCYADLTATGRYLHFVEEWVRRVRPFYANSHTVISWTGRIMTELREEARRVVRRSVHATERHEVVFVGTGATAAINKLVGLLGIRIPEPLERAYLLSEHIPKSERPVVFLSAYEHHSNALPWFETIAEVVEIGLDASGAIDLADLRAKLKQYAHRPLKIGTFSAASNVTGVLSDVAGIASVLHEHDAWAFFDYAAAGPYIPIDMDPPNRAHRIDAIFLSMHKFVGGPQASGILIADRALFRSRVPERPGGGTVDYVSAFDSASIDYVQRLDEREEGGTPAIMGDIRAGIAFVVKEMIDPVALRDHEIALAKSARERLARHPRIHLLGDSEVLPRLAILSFNIERLHHDLVSVLLDHLFGIQNRAGCACAGPYGHRLLGIDHARSERYRTEISTGCLGLKPGWVRVTLPYYASAEDLEFILSAIEFVADHGRDFVPAYCLGWRDGVWRHIGRPMPDVMPLEMTVHALEEAAQSFAAGDFELPLTEAQLAAERAAYFVEAKRVAADLRGRWAREPPAWNPPTGRAEADELVFFDFVHGEGFVHPRA